MPRAKGNWTLKTRADDVSFRGIFLTVAGALGEIALALHRVADALENEPAASSERADTGAVTPPKPD